MRPSNPRPWPAASTLALAIALLGPAASASAQQWSLGGDVRAYQFLRVDDRDTGRRDAELGIGRLKLDGRFPESLSTEAHGVVAVVSPSGPVATRIVSGTTRRFLELQHTFSSDDDVSVTLEADRLNVRWEHAAVRLVTGRQAITWGVNYFWPVLDLFAPFAPERIDREYKPGVDAARATVAIGALSQLDIVAAMLGDNVTRDGSVGALMRVNAGPADVGLMLGHFHRDTVAGAFVTANVLGTGVRGEIAFTDSGDPEDARLGRATFWRAGVGLDRQLTATLSLTAELSWNGFGTLQTGHYAATVQADRVRRGEVDALGQYYFGGSLSWQAHPLVVLATTALVNMGDGSALLLPHGDWSVSDAISVAFGGIVGVGADRAANGALRSEYGAVPATVYVAVKFYF